MDMLSRKIHLSPVKSFTASPNLNSKDQINIKALLCNAQSLQMQITSGTLNVSLMIPPQSVHHITAPPHHHSSPPHHSPPPECCIRHMPG